MTRHILLACAATIALGAGAAAPLPSASYDVIPLPQEVVLTQGKPFKLDFNTLITYPAGNADLARNASMLASYIEEATSMKLNVRPGQDAQGNIMLLDSLETDNAEAYVLTVTDNGVTINGATPAANFYGCQVLRKALPVTKGEALLPAVVITDRPRFAYRGMHLDVCRHFFPVDSVKQYIDMLALHQMNRMHWHLTEDQGWRVEIKSRPELTRTGAWRSGTVMRGVEDSIPHGGYYTQDQIRDVVRYAQDRYITIVPEVDLPGHMVAALASYPELGCTGGPYEVRHAWGVSDDVLCAGNDSVYAFLDDVMGEIVDLFPSEYVHAGGDECPKVRWETCPKCQAKIKELGLVSDEHGTAEAKLQGYVMQHVCDFLASHGRRMIGWDEILEGDIPPSAVVMSWRGEAGGRQASAKGHDVVMTPNNYCYFDYYQSSDRDKEPLGIGGYVPVDTVYNYDPYRGLTPQQAAHILGVQANVWTEYIPAWNHVQYMTLPRMSALSEVQWTEPQRKDYNDFLRRLPRLAQRFKRNGWRYAHHVVD